MTQATQSGCTLPEPNTPLESKATTTYVFAHMREGDANMVPRMLDSMKNACPSVEMLSAFFQGVLSEEPMHALAEHLDGCIRCRMKMAELVSEQSAAPHLALAAENESEEEACRRVVDSISAIPELLDAEERPSIGRYLLRERLSQREVGDVYKALDPNMGRFCAVKRLRPSVSQEPEFLAQFKRECMTLANLDHPAIVRALDAGEDAGVHYLATEYIAGRTLQELVATDGPLDVNGWTRAALELATALRVIHQAGFVHRDVKPSNIIRTETGGIKLLDFGLSAQIGSPSSGPLGTPGFASPEQAAGGIAADPRADYFSLGATLYFLGTGEVPLVEPNQAERGSQGPEKRSDLSADRFHQYARDLGCDFNTLLSPEPDARPSSLDELIRALELSDTSRRSGVMKLLASPRDLIAYSCLFIVAIACVGYLLREWRPDNATKIPWPRKSYYAMVAEMSDSPAWLDRSFGKQGIVISDINQTTDYANAIVVQPDGKIVVAGSADGDFALCRFLANGQPDMSFGEASKVRVGIGELAACYGMAIQPDGKVITTGHALSSASLYDFALIRFDGNGKLDPSFGDQGICITSFPERTEDAAFSIVVQSDGKLVVAGSTGTSNLSFGVARYHASGILDESFGAGGLLSIDWGPGPDEARRVIATPDGKLLIAGQATHPATGKAEFAIIRLLADGAMDPTFGLSGRVTTAVGTDGDRCYGASVQPDGKILLAGGSRHGPKSSLATVVRYLPGGELDTSFGHGGAASVAVGDQRAWARALLVQQNGAILIVGYTEDDRDRSRAFAWRVHAEGKPDTRFGNDGILFLTPPGVLSSAQALAQTPTGQAVIAGQIHWEGAYEMLLTKLTNLD